MSEPFKDVSRDGKGEEMSERRKVHLCNEWLDCCRATGWKNDALSHLADLFWKHEGWRTFKGYKP